jgi:probable O-glycosylation ligase (exosortase A-associated)
MRDLVVLAALVVFVVFALRSVLAAYLLWGWANMVAIGNYLFGPMASVPYVQIFAAITIAGLLLHRDPLAAPFRSSRTIALLGLLVVHGTFVALLAYPGLSRNWELWGNLVKILVFCSVMPMVLTSRTRIHAFVIVVVIAVGFHGLLDGLKFLASGGGHNARGIPKFGDNNQFALVLLLIVPLAYYLYRYSLRRWVALGFLGVAILTCLAIVATHSRGALIGMFVMGGLFVLLDRHKVRGALLLVAVAILVSSLAPAEWFERMDSINQAAEDASFLGRVASWKVSSAIALAHPVFGGGFRAVQSDEVWARFANAPSLLDFVDLPGGGHHLGVAAHSIWFEVMGDMGLMGLTIFVMLLLTGLLNWRWLRRVAAGHRELVWVTDLANMLMVALVVYMVSGSLLSAAYFELPYMALALMQVLRLHVQRSIRPTMGARETSNE